MKNRIIVKAPAKINLGLAVLGRRPDGYHELASVMQQISLSDYLVLEPCREPGLVFRCSDPALAGEDNLVCRAAGLLERHAGCRLPGVRLTLLKNIPVEAGLGGGSSDAAAALRALNSYWELALADAQLADLGASLGSDIPFCLLGGTALATGRGEHLMALPALPFYWVVLASPAALRLSTAAVYRSLDWTLAEQPPVDQLVQAVKQGSRSLIREWFDRGVTNSLESAVIPRRRDLHELKQRFRELGLLPAMSGSGPSIFALSGDLRAARAGAAVLQAEGNRAFLCWTANNSLKKEADRIV